MPIREKSAAELEQERRDEEYARQLQNQFDAPAAQPQQQQQQNRQVVCVNCQAMNHIPHAPPDQQFKCGSCGVVLSIPTSPPPPPPGAYPGAAPAPLGGGGVRSPLGSTITCQNCRCANTVPVGATTQFMCGNCYRVLTFNQNAMVPPAAAPLSPPLPAQTGLGGGGGVLQGTVQRTVQVRCGQCSAINSVKQGASPKIEFICGSCRATNEVMAQ